MNGLRPLRIPPLNRGCVATIVFENVDENGDWIDMTDKRVFITAKNTPWDDDPDDSDAIFKVEGVVSVIEPGRVTFELSEEDTYQDPDDDYFFDIVTTNEEGADAERLAIGEFKIIGGANNAQAGGDE